MTGAMSTAEHFIMIAVICASLAVMVVLLFLAAHQSDRPRLPVDQSRQPSDRDRQFPDRDPQPSDRGCQPSDRGRQAEPADGSGPPYGHHGGGTATA